MKPAIAVLAIAILLAGCGSVPLIRTLDSVVIATTVARAEVIALSPPIPLDVAGRVNNYLGAVRNAAALSADEIRSDHTDAAKRLAVMGYWSGVTSLAVSDPAIPQHTRIVLASVDVAVAVFLAQVAKLDAGDTSTPIPDKQIRQLDSIRARAAQ